MTEQRLQEEELQEISSQMITDLSNAKDLTHSKEADSKPVPLADRNAVAPDTVSALPKKQSRSEYLKERVLIPEYLRKAVLSAVESKGASYIEGRPFNQDAQAPAAPLFVFINPKSGGRMGPALQKHLVDLISAEQVFDPLKTSPSDIVRHGLGCLEKLAKEGDDCARLTRERLRILVAGGDGTVGWVLGCIGELHLEDRGTIPPVGIIPLGTGNDLARSFGWGKSFSSAHRSGVKKWLLKATEGSTPCSLDCWQVEVRTGAKLRVAFPHALKPQQHIPLADEDANNSAADDSASFRGVFYNYFSIGMDAQVAYGFHELRNKAPWIARGPVSNKIIYSGYTCWQGWFCTPCSANPRARGVNKVLRLHIQRKQSTTGDWEEVHIPSSVRAVVICNLQSYGGGSNPWGLPTAKSMKKKGLVDAKSDDGLLEVFGLRNGWDTAFIMISLLTAKRLCQAEALRLELQGNNRSRIYMQMDGEPWRHPLNSDGKPTIVEINRVPVQSTMLVAK
ncbi:hypothetical protein O6H91_05G094600 [Diphasiastrum complanatum]|uniref:Uncharacterized protein n=2 Tax=Diphasiastrum complanatum TaxID=34168 RepID=A0ACC2DR12_DIPCM|nr:hypothetical protein O6H91_05G094600 [Diphasiastrum complanatum]KAJ7556699.1 hypothetical protein O6H91_05G094600 [Diphasiastrum complanatum]